MLCLIYNLVEAHSLQKTTITQSRELLYFGKLLGKLETLPTFGIITKLAFSVSLKKEILKEGISVVCEKQQKRPKLLKQKIHLKGNT